MPFEGEFAHYRPLRRVVESQRVKSLLSSCRIRETTTDPVAARPLILSDIASGGSCPPWVLAVDGGHAEVPVRNGYPGAEASYITVASVLLDVAKMRLLDEHRPVDPKEFRTTEQADSIDCALPGCNVVMQSEGSAKSSLRRGMFEIFGSVRMAPDGESLLDTYEALLEYKPLTNREQHCPYEECGDVLREFKRGCGEYKCQCQLEQSIFSTDALRIHEGMNPAGTNGAMFAEIMQVWERVWIVHILRTMEAKGWLSSLQRLAIVLDGPLAVFGHPAWLSQAIHQELVRINSVVRKRNAGQDLLLMGIEKTGFFVDHLLDLDRGTDGKGNGFPSSGVALLTDTYIKRNIIFSDSPKPYGEDTYFGRKFYYKTKSGVLIVGTLPFLTEEARDSTKAEPSLYPRLPDTLALLDDLVSSRYPNAVVPLVAAHKEAAIPLHLGSKVLERLAKGLVLDA